MTTSPQAKGRKEDGIVVQRAWFKGLLSNAQQVEDMIDKLDTDARLALLKLNIHSLLGYISSAETIIREYKPVPPKGGSKLK